MILAVLSIFILLAYIISLKKELRRMIKQLNSYNSFQNEKKIDVSLFSKEVEQLGESINKCIDISRQEKLKEVKLQNKLKELVSNVSHDLRTPLTSILGYIQLLKSNDLNSKKREKYISIIERKSEDLQNLLNNFFMLSVVESDDYELAIEVFDISELLCDVLSDFYDDFTKKEMEVKVEVAKNSIKVFGNKNSTKRVIENLLVNVLKYSSGKNAFIKLEKQGDFGVLVIENESDEITVREVEKLFDKFYIVDSSRTISKNSTGLGLAIVKKLMEKMNGEVKAEKLDNKISIKCYWALMDLL